MAASGENRRIYCYSHAQPDHNTTVTTSALLLGFGRNLCRWSLAADAAGTAPAYLLATQRLLEQLGGGRSVLSAFSWGNATASPPL